MCAFKKCKNKTAQKHIHDECIDISTSDAACYGLCSVVASCSCHRLHGGSSCLCARRAVLWVALWDRQRPVSAWPNIWHRFSQSCGWAKYHLIHLSMAMLIPKIIIFHNKLWWPERARIEGINLHLCVRMHVCMINCCWQAIHHNYLVSGCHYAHKKRICTVSSRGSRYHLQRCVTTTHVWVEAIAIL